MRKAILVVALIGASFAGGAAVNGPGLAWARTFIGAGAAPPRDGLPADAPPGEIAVTDDAAAAPGGVLPAAPLPPITAPAAAAEKPARPTPPEPAAPPRAEGNPTPAPADAAGPPLDAPKADRPEPAAGASPPTPLEVPAPPAPRSDAPPADSPATPPATEVGWADAPGSAPAEAVLPGRPPASRPRVDAGLSAAAMPAAATDKGWADLRRRLRASGVTRYWIEADPAGPVRFRCLIPQAGRRAVSQHFEGEGDDELQAAEAALKRVALWKATEGQ